MIKFTTLGRLVRDVETTQAKDTVIAKLSVASNRGDKDKTTDFADITAFGKLAENIAKYFHKGDMIYLEGNIQFDTVEKDGQKRKYTNLIANSFQFCGSSSKDNSTSQPTIDNSYMGDDSDLPF